MAKFCGKVGFETMVEGEGGVFRADPIEKIYRGDILNMLPKYESSDKLHDDLTLSNEISILADSFAYENFQYMRYVILLGVKWEITSAKIERPRILLRIGGVYNGRQGPQA